ncbi:uncharacterized protein LOC131802550 [Musca domestica]|uniref:Uncharacterized protein LOC131802550 n=1 Tax=Musca domestica TaxID=7370 RepID=A0ABM3UZ94_MUSDO|nr:uncharacterized protein LOC131802550 [Musca domestica]
MDKSLSDKFTNCVNDLLDYISIFSITKPDDTVHTLETTRMELDSAWDQVKRAYIDCRDYVPEEEGKPIDKNKLRKHYMDTMGSYKKALSSINGQIQNILDEKTQEKMKRESEMSQQGREVDFTNVSRLPPCDTDTFKGGYREWPTFRDLFSAIYINNSKLSNVEKLFHLTQKTAGEAREIISHVPLTNDGFTLAWKNLTDRYENKRMQINEEIKTLFNLPGVSAESSHSIQKLQRTVNSSIQTLGILDVDVKGWDPILIYICSTKLPRGFLEEFENSLSDCKQIPKWEQFDAFLTNKFKTLESVGNIKPSTSKFAQQKPTNNHTPRFLKTFQTNVSKNTNNFGGRPTNVILPQQNKPKNTQTCQVCKSNHFIRDCSEFLKKSVNDRIHIVKTSHLCYNCLSSNHGVKDCKSRFGCRICTMKHNTLLHKGTETQTTNSYLARVEARPSTSAAALTNQIQSTTNLEPTTITTLTLQDKQICERQSGGTLLFTAIVQIETKGQLYDARALIDSGSQSTFISEKMKNFLKLPTRNNLVHVTGLSQFVSETSTKSCLFTMRSKYDPSFKLEVWAPVLKNLPSNLPPQNLDESQLRDVTALELADPKFYVSQPIDILIGMDIGPLIFTIGTPMKTFGSILTQKTKFGWIVGGPIPGSILQRKQISLLNTTSIEKVLTRFWEVEETPKKVLRSEEDQFCEQNFIETTIRNKDGRYVVTLPFKKCEELGNSRNISLAQFYRMEKKLMKTPEIKEQYDASILEYLELGHMRKVNPNEIDKMPNYYLPHHAVIKPDRLTTKLRVVFNASCPTSNKTSLNDILYPGPILQQDLVLQILKWRFFKYAFNADITKMYRQILLDPNQTKYQRILFRKSPENPVEDYELLTVTFGVNCAPYLALRTLLKLAEDVKESYPRAANIILNNLYVDDVLAGGHTEDESIKARKELTAALDSAGFTLMKWASNDRKIIQDIPHEHLLPLNWLDISEDASTKTLGIRWNISGDYFSFTPPSMENKNVSSKREVLSTIAKLFDPCGWLAPVVVVAKLIMQQIWLDKIDWDDQLKPITQMNWNNFVKNSKDIEYLRVPRWIQYTLDGSVEIHGFCDASESAYGATLYIRVENTDHTTHTFLLAAKTRVAPIKKLSIPRLELCGAVLLSKLAKSIVNSLQISKYSTQFWTDSTIVLAWLKKPPCHWSTFVGNRVSEIADNVGQENWRHVDSENNPADIASRLM